MSEAIPSDDPTAMPSRLPSQPAARHQFILYILDTTPHSTRAIVNTRKICETHFSGLYNLEIVDIAKAPQLAAESRIIATPTLVRISPLPQRRFVGDMSRTEDVLAGLGLQADQPEETHP